MFKRQVKFKIFFYLTVEGGGWGTEGKGIDICPLCKKEPFLGSLPTLLFLIVGSLACVHTTKVEQWVLVCLKLV